MLSPWMVKAASDAANQALKIILKTEPINNSSPSKDRNPEQIALIGKIIQEAIKATQPLNIFQLFQNIPVKAAEEEHTNEASTD